MTDELEFVEGGRVGESVAFDAPDSLDLDPPATAEEVSAAGIRNGMAGVEIARAILALRNRNE